MPDFPPLAEKVDFPPGRLVDFPFGRRVDFPPWTPLSMTLYPTADARVDQANPDQNFGLDEHFVVSTFLLEEQEFNQRSFLKFDLTPLPSGALITSAKLRCFAYAISDPLTGVTDVQARRVTDDSWVEDGITWNNQPAYGDVEDTKVLPPPEEWGWLEWNVTSWVQNEWVGDKTVSLCLKCVQESYDDIDRGINCHSKEYDGYDPELYIEYTIEGWEEQTVYPTADSYVENIFDLNHGTEIFLRARYDGPPPEEEDRTLLKFDVTTLPPSATGFQIRLLTANPGDIPMTLTLYSVTDDSWTETGVKWSNQPVHIDALVSILYPGTGGWIQFEGPALDTFIQSQIAGDGIASFKILVTAGIAAEWFDSREFAGTDSDPRLYLPAYP